MIRSCARFLIPFVFPGFKLLIWHRLSRLLFTNGFRRAALLVEGYVMKRFGCAISPEAEIHPTVRMGHPIGIVIGGGTKIERDVIIFQNVTLGRLHHALAGCPHIKAGAILYTGAVVLGDITVGTGATVGALSVVTRSVPDGVCFINRRERLSREA